MYKGKKVLCVIPCRSGSKGLPGKNIRRCAGKPLVAWSIGQAKRSRLIDRCVVSTDSPRIAAVSRRYGGDVPFLRPRKLATDNANVLDALIHCLDELEPASGPFDIVVLLHATAPLRTPGDIDACIRKLVDEKLDNVFSVTGSHRNPYFNMIEIRGGKVALVKKGDFVTRQACPPVYDMNASIYVWQVPALRRGRGLFTPRTGVYVMPKERSVDIDDAFDFKVVSLMLEKR